MTSQVEVPPLTGLIHFFSSKKRVNIGRNSLASLSEHDITCLSKQCRGSALFAIKYVNLYQQSGSSNLIG